MKMPGFNLVTRGRTGMTEPLFDLLYIVDAVVTIILKVGLISIVLQYLMKD